MGRIFIESLGQADWPLAMTYLVIVSGLYVLANLLADVLYTIVDPRIRYG